MTRTIMLVPIGNSVGLTMISVSLLKLVYKNKFSAIFFKPFPDICNGIDDTANIVKRVFGIPSIQPVTPLKTMFISEKEYNRKLIQDNVDLYYSYQNKYDIIFIEGKKNSNSECYVHDLNLKFLYQIRCELIFYNVNCNDFYKEFCFYKKKYNLKYRILGIINNFYDISIKQYNDILFLPYFLVNYNIQFNKTSVIVSNIPWNKKLIYFPIYEIFQLIKIENTLKKYEIQHIDSFVLYDQCFFNIIDHIFHSVLLIPFYKFIQKYESLCVILQCNILYAIVLTDCNKYDIYNFSILQKQFKYKSLLFYTKLKFDQVILSINMFHKNMIIKNKIYLNLVIVHLIRYINKKLILCLLVNNRKKIIHFSPYVFQQYLIEKAKNSNSHILLPEGSEERIVHAASIVSNLGIVRCTLLGDEKIIYQIAKKNGWNITNNVNIVNPINIYKNYIEKLFLLRAHKGITWQLSEKYVQDHMVLGALLLLENQVDGVVCGVKYTTAEVLRTAIQLIGIKKNIHSSSSIVSSSFFMLLKNSILLYSDCAVNIDPNVKQLVNIVLDTSDLAILFDMTPKIAMLSYSTGMSGSGNTVEKVRKATCLVKKIRPDLTIDGPIQYDAAINPEISNIKLPQSYLNGKANVFIFPDLNSGNITYKAVQQSLNISSIGPILQGLIQPVNDLSRGATVNDIVYTILVTAIQKKLNN